MVKTFHSELGKGTKKSLMPFDKMDLYINFLFIFKIFVLHTN